MDKQAMDELLDRRIDEHYRHIPGAAVLRKFEFFPGVVGVEVKMGEHGPFFELWYDKRWNVPVNHMRRYGSPDHETGVGVVQYHLTMSEVRTMEGLLSFMYRVLEQQK